MEQTISKKIRWMIIGFSLIRIILQMGIPCVMIGSFADDDMLMVHYAQSILAGNWLGAYSVHALNKVPAFSIFLATAKAINLPYMLGLGIGYVIACYVFFRAVRRTVKSDKIAFLCYLFLLFSPVMIGGQQVQRIYRNSIIPILVLLVISSYLIIYCERKGSVKRLALYGAGCGVAFSFFYLTREDSIWLGCFVFGAIVLIVGKLFLERKIADINLREFVVRCICVCMPVILCFGVVNVLKLTNYIHYGVYVTTDFKDTSFADMGKAILSIKTEEEIEYVWVTRNTIEKLYEVSPTLASMRNELESVLELTDNMGSGVIDGEVEKDYIIWAIRWAADRANVYEDGKKADAFYRQIYNEIEAAFESGMLEKNDKIILSNLTNPLTISKLPECLAYLLRQFKKTIDYSYMECLAGSSNGAEEDIRLMSNITSSIAPVGEKNVYGLAGWAFAYDDNSKLRIEIEDENGDVCRPDLLQSEDVYRSFIAKGNDYTNAKNCRFNLMETNDGSGQRIFKVYLDGKVVLQGMVEDLQTTDTDQYVICVDKNETEINSDFTSPYVGIANKIRGVYGATGYVMAALAGIIFVAELIINMKNVVKKRQTYFAQWLIKLGLLLTIFADMLIVSINYFEAYSADYIFGFYTMGIYPVWQVFICLCLCSGFNFLLESEKFSKVID